MADDFKYIAPRSRRADFETDEGRQSIRDDIDILFRRLTYGLTIDYMDADTVGELGLGAEGAEVAIQPEYISGQTEREPVCLSGEVVPLIGGEAMGGEVEVGPIPIGAEAEGSP